MFDLKMSTSKGNIESLMANERIGFKEILMGFKEKKHHFEQDENHRGRLMLCLLCV